MLGELDAAAVDGQPACRLAVGQGVQAYDLALHQLLALLVVHGEELARVDGDRQHGLLPAPLPGGEAGRVQVEVVYAVDDLAQLLQSALHGVVGIVARLPAGGQRRPDAARRVFQRVVGRPVSLHLRDVNRLVDQVADELVDLQGLLPVRGVLAAQGLPGIVELLQEAGINAQLLRQRGGVTHLLQHGAHTEAAVRDQVVSFDDGQRVFQVAQRAQLLQPHAPDHRLVEPLPGDALRASDEILRAKAGRGQGQHGRLRTGRRDRQRLIQQRHQPVYLLRIDCAGRDLLAQAAVLGRDPVGQPRPQQQPQPPQGIAQQSQHRHQHIRPERRAGRQEVPDQQRALQGHVNHDAEARRQEGHQQQRQEEAQGRPDLRQGQQQAYERRLGGDDHPDAQRGHQIGHQHKRQRQQRPHADLAVQALAPSVLRPASLRLLPALGGQGLHPPQHP